MKRGNGGDGFLVMSLTDGEDDEVALVAAIGFCVRDGEFALHSRVSFVIDISR